MLQTRRHLSRWAVAAVIVAMGCSGGVAAADPTLPAPPNPGYPPVTAPPQLPAAHAPGGGPVGLSAPPALPAGAPTAAAPSAAGAPPLAAPAPTAIPVGSGTLRDYLTEKGVQLEAQQPQNFTALTLTLPMPPGWTAVPDPNVPDAFAVIANRRSGTLYTPNAQLVVYRLVGRFDPKEAITHGFVDSQQQFAWQTTNASLADFDGFPSSVIEGTYRENDMTLNTSRRHVIAASGADSYLVTLTVTTGAGQSVAHAPATDAIVNGFRVAAPAAH